MSKAPRYGFRRVEAGDRALLADWQARPHVRRWWDGEGAPDAEELADPRVARWIVSLNDRPFAYLQDYTVHGWPDHHFAALPEGARGIDQYIGEAELTGLGHGPAFIRARMRALFETGAPVVATDPHPDNARAIAAYRKAGFEAFGPPRQTPWGLILPMRATR